MPVISSGLRLIIFSVLAIAVLSYSEQRWLASDTQPTYLTIGTTTDCFVEHVADGDTVTLLCEKEKIRARLFGIDAPEMGQKPWGNTAKQVLQQLIGQTTVKVDVLDHDRYQRHVVKLFNHQQQDVGLQLVTQGHAVVYERYNTETDYLTAQKAAQKQRLGVWAKSGSQQTPEKWRRLNPR